MAGYMTALQGYVYEGELVNGNANPIENGMLVAPKLVEGAMVFDLPTANTDTKFTCKEVTTIYDGIPAYRFIVKAIAAPVYFVENGFDDNGAVEYDHTLFSTASGKYLRAHPLLVGEEFVTNKVTGTPAVGTDYGVKADGTVG